MLKRTTEETIVKAKAAKAARIAIALAAQPSTFIALKMLALSEDNVRTTTSADGIAELAELIYFQGLLAALHVVPQLVDGRESSSGRCGRNAAAGSNHVQSSQISLRLGLSLESWHGASRYARDAPPNLPAHASLPRSAKLAALR